MFLSFTGLKTQCADLTSDNSTESATFFATNINIGLGILESELGSFYTEETDTITTTADEDTYALPVNFIRLKSAYITLGTYNYPMEEVFEEDEWQMYKRQTQPSNILTKIFVTRDNVEVFPTPSDDDLVITIKFEAGGRELTAEDYTTGTITTLANGSTALTASGTTFTSSMVGRYIYLPDGNWYKISAFLTTTTLTLAKAYEGVSITAGTETFKIGECPRTPPATHHIPALYAVWQYYEGYKKDTSNAELYKSRFEQELKRAKATYGRRYSTRYILGKRVLRVPINPNNYPSGMT